MYLSNIDKSFFLCYNKLYTIFGFLSIPIFTNNCTILTFFTIMKNELVTTNVPEARIRLKTYTTNTTTRAILSDLHYHDEIELLAITEGELFCVVSGKAHLCQKGDVLFFSARIPHSTYVQNSNCSYTLVQFRPELFLGDSNNTGKYFNRFVRNADLPFAILHNRELYRMIEKALEEEKHQQEAFGLYIKGAVFAIIALLCREGALSTSNSVYSADIKKILPALSFIDENYAQDITLDDVAKQQNLNPSYFCRVFKRASGSSFVDYLNFVRVCKSEKLLAAGEKSILEVAGDVGFTSLSYFNRIFKRYKNCTPTEYRRAHYENRA